MGRSLIWEASGGWGCEWDRKEKGHFQGVLLMCCTEQAGWVPQDPGDGSQAVQWKEEGQRRAQELPSAPGRLPAGSSSCSHGCWLPLMSEGTPTAVPRSLVRGLGAPVLRHRPQ